MGRLIILLALVLLVLAVFFIVRAIRASRQARANQYGYYVEKFDYKDGSAIRIMFDNKLVRTERVIGWDEPDYSERVIEEFARAEAKASDWNSTNRALDLDHV